MAPWGISAITGAAAAAALLGHSAWASSAPDAIEADAALVEQDDACSSEESCDLSLRQLRATHRHEQAEEHAAAEAERRFKLMLESNGISSGTQAEYVGTDAETGGQLLKLYHQTSPEAGQSILKTGFRLGSGGLCGPAIYFSPSPKDTDVKAVGGRGFIIEAIVDMGRMKVMNGQCDHSMNTDKMREHGWDSLTLDRGGFGECWFLPHCYEYIIYDNHRIKHMKGYPYNGWRSWFPGFPKVGAQGQPSGQAAHAISEGELHHQAAAPAEDALPAEKPAPEQPTPEQPKQ